MIYDFNFNQNFAALLPARLRLKNWLALMAVLSVPLQWLRDAFFNSYVLGSIDALYSAGTQYAKGNRVRYNDNAVYEAIQIPPVGNLPTDSNNWYKVQDSWVGFAERITYTSQKIRLEYALNNNFGISVSLPFSGANQTNQIFITNSTVANNPFVIGGASPSVVYATETYATNYVINAYDLDGKGFVVNVPSAKFLIYGEPTLRQFIDKYVTAGIKYTIISY